MRLLPNPRNVSAVSVGRWIRLNLLLGALVLVIGIGFPVSTLSQKLNDFYFRIRFSQPASPRVALVLIDDEALGRYGRWPWPRSLLARLVRNVNTQKPKAIGIDILLSEPEDESNDSQLAEAIRAAPNLVLASKISSSSEGRLWIDPLPRFLGPSAGAGHVQAIIDTDGLCRSIPIQEPSADGLRTAFSVKLALLVRPDAFRLEDVPKDHVSVLGSGSTRPLLIDFHRQFEAAKPDPPFLVVSAGDILSGKATEQLEGKVVLLGFGAVEIGDRLFTPVSEQLPMPGVEINANVVDMLLAGVSLKQMPWPLQLFLLLCVNAGSLWVVVRYPGALGLSLLAAILVGGYLGGYLLFAHFHLLFAYGPLLIAAVLAAPIAQLENLVIVDRAVTDGLRRLRQTIEPQPDRPSQYVNRNKNLDAAARLHWKLEALQELQTELSSLYTFNRTVLETMREGLAVFGADGTPLFCNSGWSRFCRKQGLGTPRWAQVEAWMSKDCASGGDAGGAWTEAEFPFGEDLWHFRALRLPWTTHAEGGAILVMVEDATARRQRDQARSEALSFVTHELRTPLISIQGFAELLMRSPKSPAVREGPATIFREANRLVALINTYLEVLRLDAGARPLRPTRANINKMVKHVDKVVRPLATSAHIQMRTEIDSGEEYVICDEPLISGVLLNLASNAIKYGAEGTEVLLHTTTANAEVEFEVHNSGRTIPPEELEHLFERFYRAPHSESIPGWGLGLSFVKRICEQHGGRVWVRSDASSGTSFCFTLPRVSQEVIEVSHES